MEEAEADGGDEQLELGRDAVRAVRIGQSAVQVDLADGRLDAGEPARTVGRRRTLRLRHK